MPSKALIAIFILLFTVPGVAGQTCKIGKTTPAYGFWMWAAGSTIQVHVLTDDFEPDELPHLLKPIDNWNAAMPATGSRVKFEYAGATTAPVYRENSLTIMRGPVFDRVKRHATELTAYSARDDQVISWASIVIDPVLTNPKAITNAIAHELGHSFGLLDCYACKRKTTAMNKFESINQPNEMDGPSTCDVAQVKLAYQELSLRVRPAPVKTEIVDEGEEPVDDDTPIVIRKPRLN